MARGSAVSVVQMPAEHSSDFDNYPPSGSAYYVFRWYAVIASGCHQPGRLQTCLKKSSRRRDLHESGAVIPHQTEGGTRESSFTSNRRFLRRKILSGTTGESRSLTENYHGACWNPFCRSRAEGASSVSKCFMFSGLWVRKDF